MQERSALRRFGITLSRREQPMAVYTPVSADSLKVYLSAYDLGDLISFHGIEEGIENTNFHVFLTRGRYVLTLFEKRVAVEDLPFFLSVLDHLARAGLPCPRPVPTRSGQVLGTLCGRSATLVTYLPGAWPRQVTVRHCALLGALLARIHRHGQALRCRRRNALSLPAWQALAGSVLARADGVCPGLAGTIAEELAALSRDWPSHLPTGLIHGDLFPDNVFFQGDRISGVFDFYFACHDHLAYDVAICLNAWCFGPDGGFDARLAAAFLHGYAAVRPLEPDEWAMLPLLARGACLRFLLTRLYDWLHHEPGALVNPKHPGEFLCKLRFHQSVRDVSAYGLPALR